MTAAVAKPPSWWRSAAEPTAAPVPEPVSAPVISDHEDRVAQIDAADPGDPEERAAIIEEGAEVPRAWAEGFAALCAMPPPAGFWPDRWQRIIDATGAFLDRWAGEAIRCGWSDLDVFGCHPDAPDRRFDCMGLVLLLDRREVVASTRTAPTL